MINIALTNVFLDCLSSQVHTSFQQRRLRNPKIIFVGKFIWFADHYGKTTSKDRKANCHHMVADWHPAIGFNILVLCLFSSAAFVGYTGFTMNNRDIVNIGLRVIKCCGIYAEEYKAWIACEAICPKIVENLDSFKMFWSAKITLVNQTSIPASLQGYGIAAVNNNDASIVLYSKSIANFGAAYAATQESVRSQGLTIASLQGQVNAIQQYCMTIQQLPPPTNYAVQQQRGPNNCRGLSQRNGGNSGGRTSYQPGKQPTNGIRAPLCPPTPYKSYKNWCYCHTHGGNVDNTHTSATCIKPGPMHNPQATLANTMGGSTAGMHKTIMPSAWPRPTGCPCTDAMPTLPSSVAATHTSPQLCCNDGAHWHASTNAGISATAADALHGASACTSPCACHDGPTSWR
jgi:hypothetical protein